MNIGNAIQESYGIGTGAWSALVKQQESLKLSGQSQSFLGMVSQAASGFSGVYGKISQAEGLKGASLEERLKAKYPGLSYHVMDISGGRNWWKTRNDYPHYLLYQEGDAAAKVLEGCMPSGTNPQNGCSGEQRALGKVPPNSKAVVIHPKVQERMEEDPAYADEILAKIETWFAFDLARNESFMPGASVGLSQAVVIGADGNIENACTSGQPSITFSQSGGGTLESWWDLRKARHADYMELMIKGQIRRRREQKVKEAYNQQIARQMRALSASSWNTSAAAKMQLVDYLRDGKLLQIFGDTVGGMPTTALMDIVRAEIWH